MKGCCMKIIDENSITRETECSKLNLDIFSCNFTAELNKTCASDHYSVFLGFQAGTQMENKLEYITSNTGKNLKISPLLKKKFCSES